MCSIMNTATRHPNMGDTTISVPEELADELYSRKGRGETYADVIRRLIAAEEGENGDREGEDTHPTASSTKNEEEGLSARSVEAADDHDIDLGDLVDDVAGEVLPGSGEKLEARREALFAVVAYLRDHGTASPADFRRDVYPEHEAGYTTGSDPPRSWWKNAMYPGLRGLAERTERVEKADTTGKWSYTGAAGGDDGT